MDVLLLNTSVFDIPSSRRVGAIAYDGTTDLRLWPGPGEDRELSRVWGDGMQAALDKQRGKLGVPELAMAQVTRVHPGRLHCDFLAWIATRVPEPGVERSQAPDAELLGRAVRSVLVFVAERSVERVALSALGGGPGALPPAERLAAVVRAASLYEDWCFAEGRAPVVEEVLVCESSNKVLSDARRLVGRLAGTAHKPPPPGAPPKKKRAPAVRRPRKPAGTRLDAEEVGRMRATVDPYDRTRTYAQGEWFVHPKFGAGRVEAVTGEGAIEVLFEDGAQKKLIHGR